MKLSNYIDQVLIRRVGVQFLGCPRVHSIVYTDHKLVRVRINLGKAKPRMARFWKFRTSVECEGFPGPATTNYTAGTGGFCVWGISATDYSRRLNLGRLVAQKALEARTEGDYKSVDSDRVALVKTELASFFNKKDQSQGFRTRLNIMSVEATNIAVEVSAEKFRSASDRHIA